MKKTRIPIPNGTAVSVLFESDLTCCVCREPGRAVQIHHIDEDPSNNKPENLAALCLLCHDKTQISGGFGRKLSAALVIKYRDEWFVRVKNRRDEAHKLATAARTGLPENAGTNQTTDKHKAAENDEISISGPTTEELLSYAFDIPSIVALGYKTARPMWDSGITSEMLQGSYNLIAVVEQILVHLARWFPENHFGDEPTQEYFSRFVSSRFVWHRAINEPEGAGTGGTIVGPISAGCVLSDVEDAVEDMIHALLNHHGGVCFEDWRSHWSKAKEPPDDFTYPIEIVGNKPDLMVRRKTEKLIEETIDQALPLSQLFLRAQAYFSKQLDAEALRWIENELNGYRPAGSQKTLIMDNGGARTLYVDKFPIYRQLVTLPTDHLEDRCVTLSLVGIEKLLRDGKPLKMTSRDGQLTVHTHELEVIISNIRTKFIDALRALIE